MLILAANCWLCGARLFLSHHGVCSYCLRQLPILPVCCPRCGLASSDHQEVCGRCLQHPPPWQALVAVSDYRLPLSRLLHKFKFQHRSELSHVIARLMLLAWLQAKRQQRVISPDCLLAVPLARKKQWTRGFNQSEQLAMMLARWLQCEVDRHSVQRTRTTPAQMTLTAEMRRTNLRGAFKCGRAVEGLNVVLVDDVVTTGSTVAEISNILLEKGASSVQIWCLCRTL